MYDDRPSPITQALVLALAAVAVGVLAAALTDFWHAEKLPDAILAVLAVYVVAAARWPWLYALLLPAGAAVAYWMPWVREGLWLDFTVWYTDIRLGQWPAPGGFLAWLLLTTLLGALGWLFVREPLKRGSAIRSAAAGTLLLGHMWLWGGDLALRQSGIFFLTVIPLWVTGGAACREKRWYSAGRRVVEGYHYVEALAGVILLGVLCVYVIPAPARGLELGPVTAWARATFPALEQMRGSSAFGDREPQGFTVAAAGFARRLSELGGPVKLDEGVALTVRVLEGPTDRTLYLRGTAMTNYTGRGWVTDTRPGDTGADSPPSGPAVALEITPRGHAGATIFYPRELSAVRGTEFKFGRESHVIVAAPLLGPYRVESYLPAGRPVGFQPPEYDPGRYLALPKALPGRVKDLAATVAGNRSSPYERALAIETYLRELPYALDVPATPPGRDFADYFLFDLKRGYCTYSATAMVVMLRSQGIPARWVQGFVLGPGQAVQDVAWSKAHAWVEAYFPGYGWATFDPTPRFALPPREGAAGETALVFDPSDDPAAPIQEPGHRRQPDSTAPGGRPFPWGWTLAGIAAAASLATSFRRWYRERIDWRDERAGLLQAFAMLGGALRRMGLGRRSHQTPSEYARSVAQSWSDMDLTGVAADVTAAMYAPPRTPVPPGARRRMGSSLAAVWQNAQRRFGRLRTAWIRVRFLWGKD